jgi:hypothetical protein
MNYAAPSWSDRRLQRLFDRYNRRFFNCQLSSWTVSCSAEDVAVLKRQGFGGWCDFETKRISIAVGDFDWDYQVRRALVHEMAHATTLDGDHFGGEPWSEEMQRLRRAGAPAQDPVRYVRFLRRHTARATPV